MTKNIKIGVDTYYKLLENIPRYFDSSILIMNISDNFYAGFSLYIGCEGITIYINNDLVNGYPSRISEYIGVDII